MLWLLCGLCSSQRAQTVAQTPAPAKASVMLRDEAWFPSIFEAQGQDISPQPMAPPTPTLHGDNSPRADLG